MIQVKWDAAKIMHYIGEVVNINMDCTVKNKSN